MPHTHDSRPFTWTKGPLILHVGSLFWHLQRYPGRRVAPRPPLSELAAPRELEDPWRKGHGRVLRLPLTRRALVVGYWEPVDPDDVVLEGEQSGRLLEAIEGAHLPDITATEIADWARATDVARLWQRLVARWRTWWTKPLYRDQSPLARRVEAVDIDLDGWEAETGWSLLPWSGMPHHDDPVIDLEQARTDRIDYGARGGQPFGYA